eukprot:CAMPEP_0117658660 /NCGR_PEP_ID=MMETSP0804-20121206/5980_1 /TAXON_ID=1074897 /ORGANISM="Tetraselmis astigmatica, Strain CCMP880" /LENGTH=317 /DNA_ID=CAMNT_0005465191 /DNA_START=577 /DNA_END=1529 /DNA_ORIENTATION=+
MPASESTWRHISDLTVGAVKALPPHTAQDDIPAGGDEVPRLVLELCRELVRSPATVPRDELEVAARHLPAKDHLRRIAHRALVHAINDRDGSLDTGHAVQHVQHLHLHRPSEVQRVLRERVAGWSIEADILHHEVRLAVEDKPIAPLLVIVMEHEDDCPIKEPHVGPLGDQEAALLWLGYEVCPAAAVAQAGMLRADTHNARQPLDANAVAAFGSFTGHQPSTKGPPIALDLWSSVSEVSASIAGTGCEVRAPPWRFSCRGSSRGRRAAGAKSQAGGHVPAGDCDHDSHPHTDVEWMRVHQLRGFVCRYCGRGTTTV